MVDPTNPQSDILGQVQNYASNALSEGNTTNSSNPYIINPQTGQLASNPGYLNSLQQVQLRLQTDPQYAAGLESEIANLTQMESMVPTSDLMNYRDAQGNTPPPGTKYYQLQDGEFSPVSAGQNEEVLQLKNALNALGKAYDASKNVNGVTAGIGGFLSKIGGGSVANMLPGYANYQSSVAALPTSLSQLPGVNLQQLFSQPGVIPTAGVQGAQNQLQTAINSLQPTSNASTQAAPSLPNSTFNPLQFIQQNPYNATANPVASPQQLGATARSITGL